MVRLAKLFISLLYWMGGSVGRVRRILGGDSPGTCIFLYYHAIKDDQRVSFAKQMDELIRSGKAVHSNFKRPLNDHVRFIGVTFDDGFTSVMKNALPELIKRNIPATLFIPTGYLGRHPEWVDDQEGYRDRNEWIMTARELQEIPSDLVSIGSHSVSHLKLPLLGKEEVRWELIASREQLESLLGRTVRLFSFPYGAHNSEIVKLAQEAGYDRVFTNLPTLALLDENEYMVGRVWGDPADTMLEFKLKVRGAYCWLPQAFKLKRRLQDLMRRFI